MKKDDTSEISILMGIYNGEKYLCHQFESLLQQTCQRYKILISDDCSIDNSRDIILKYQKIYYKNRMIFTENTVNLGINKNFNKLITQAKSRFYMFCDQDDIWLADKVEISYNKMLELEYQYGNDTPLLLFSDKIIIDSNEKVIAKSSIKYENYDVKSLSLNKIIIQNIASGCTMIFNNALKRLINSIPDGAIMYDHWLAIIATVFGRLEYINLPLIKYRLHESNTTNTNYVNMLYYLKKIKRKKFCIRYARFIQQAECFYHIYFNQLNDAQKSILENFISLKNASFIQRVKIIHKYNLYKKSLIQKIGMFF